MGYCGVDTKDDHKKGNEEIEKINLKKKKLKKKKIFLIRLNVKKSLLLFQQGQIQIYNH